MDETTVIICPGEVGLKFVIPHKIVMFSMQKYYGVSKCKLALVHFKIIIYGVFLMY